MNFSHGVSAVLQAAIQGLMCNPPTMPMIGILGLPHFPHRDRLSGYLLPWISRSLLLTTHPSDVLVRRHARTWFFILPTRYPIWEEVRNLHLNLGVNWVENGEPRATQTLLTTALQNGSDCQQVATDDATFQKNH